MLFNMCIAYHIERVCQELIVFILTIHLTRRTHNIMQPLYQQMASPINTGHTPI